MCRSLANYGEDVTIFTTNFNYPCGHLNVPLYKKIKQDGYNIFYFPFYFPKYILSFGLFRELKQKIKKFDLVHIHGIYQFPQAAAAYLARQYKVPYIIRPHGSLDPFLYKRNRIIKRVYEYLIENRNLNGATAIHFTTSDEEQLVKTLEFSAPSVVIPNGLELKKYKNLPTFGKFRNKYRLGDKKIILFFGRINFKKGLDILVRAFANLTRKEDDVLLVIAGPDNDGYKSQVELWINKENIASKVIFTGMLHEYEALCVLRDADIFALTSYTENFGIAVVEAMSCGLPVIISDQVNIWREVYEHGAGLITSCNVNEVEEAFKKLINDDRKRKEMGSAGRMLVRKKYDWDIITKKLIATYRELCSIANT